jgi:magnesium transporter
MPVAEPRPGPAELRAGGVTWVHLLAPTAGEAQLLAGRFGWHPLDVEDVLSRRQRPKIDVYPGEEDGSGGYLFAVLHFPVYDATIGRLNAGELDVFIGPDYIVTLPAVELRPVSLLFQRCAESEEIRTHTLSRGSGRLLYEVLDDLYDYCFPILDKIGFKLEQIDEAIGQEQGAKDLVTDIHKVKQEIISYRKIIKPQRPTLRSSSAASSGSCRRSSSSTSTTSSTRASGSGTSSTTTRRSWRRSRTRTSRSSRTSRTTSSTC